MVEDAQPQHVAAADPPGRDEDLAAALDPFGNARVESLQNRFVVDTTRVAPERDDPQRGRRHQLQFRRALDPALRVQREVEAGVYRRAEGRDTEIAQRDPELESAATPGELQAEV
jgi:hypothetical protein